MRKSLFIRNTKFSITFPKISTFIYYFLTEEKIKKNPILHEIQCLTQYPQNKKHMHNYAKYKTVSSLLFVYLKIYIEFNLINTNYFVISNFH